MNTKDVSSKRRFLTIGSLLGAAILLLVSAQNGSAQWSGTTNIYYNGGNVGIGTSTPGVKLEVSGTPATSGNLFKFSGADSNGNLFNEIASTGTGGAILKLSGGSGTSFNLQSTGSGSGVGNNRFVIGTPSAALFVLQSDGNLGLGTSSPSDMLHIYKSAASNAQILVENPSNADGAQSTVRLKNDAGGLSQVGIYGSGTSAFGAIGSGEAYHYSSNSLAFMAGGASGIIKFASGGNTERMRINASGNIGIGTTSPTSGYKLDVNGNTNVTGNLNSTGTITGGNIVAKYQDVAEWVPCSEKISTGTVVVLDTTKSNQVISSTQSYDTRVAGVISEQPGIALGERGANKVLVATSGRVIVKVDATNGPIHIGDLLVTSDISGMAMKSEPITVGNRKMHTPGTLIGKALEPLEKGSGKILVLLSLQ